MKKLFVALLLALAVVAPRQSFAQADSTAADSTKHPSVLKVWAGANAVWFDDSAKPADVELGLTSAASLYHPISLVGSAFVGIDKQYVSGSGGVRFSLSDSAAYAASVALSAERQFSNKKELRPNEWVGKASVGFRPWPKETPQVVLGFQTSYGFTSNTFNYLAAFRYRLGGK